MKTKYYEKWVSDNGEITFHPLDLDMQVVVENYGELHSHLIRMKRSHAEEVEGLNLQLENIKKKRDKLWNQLKKEKKRVK